jgi:hypothetical protein
VSQTSALEADLDRIVDYPWEVLEYLTWLRQQTTSRAAGSAYAFEEPEVRFTWVEADLLVSERDLRVVSSAGGLRLTSPRAPAGLLIEELGPAERDAVARLVQALDGQRPLAAIRAELAPPASGVLDRLLRAAFGKLIFAPLAILESERRISGVEITRFPGSPYEIARPFWRNMGSLRARSDGLFSALGDDASFVRELRKLHVIALMGEDLQSYYLPASPIASGRAAPGRFMLTGTERVDDGNEGCIFISGPRVNASAVGGNRYHEMLYETLGEPEAALPRHFESPDGLDLGHLVRGKAAADSAAALWFCPPRPLRQGHLRALRQSLASAVRDAEQDPAACVSALAAFHQDFVRLHPFHCGNQSVAMNIVNGVAGRALGAGLPHLMLDHLAFRLGRGAYARLFARAARAYADPQSTGAARYHCLASHRTRTFDLLRRLDQAPTLDTAWELTRADAEAARLLLLTDG